MTKTVFNKSMRVLIIALLLLAILIPRKQSQKLMLVAVGIWLLFQVIVWIVGHVEKPTHKQKRQRLSLLNRITPARNRPSTEELFRKEENPYHEESPSRSDTLGEQDIRQMLQHIALRISDKLKSAYPNALWQWMKEPDLKGLLSGETIRISVENMDQFTHADIHFDCYGRIHVEPMTIGTLHAAKTKDVEADPNEATPEEPSVVDVRVWFDLIGQKILNEQITNLNAQGHSKLTIRENGDVVIRRQKNDALLTTLEAFPGRPYWEELVSILSENELNARIMGDKLQISWI